MRGSGRFFRAGAFALTAAVGSSASASVLQAQVTRGTGEVTLQGAVTAALESNRELETARLQLVAAEGQVREAWSAVYPSVDFTASYTRNLDVPGQFLPAQLFDPDAEPGELTLVRFGSDNNWFSQVRLDQTVFQASVFLGLGAASRYRALQEEVVRGREHEIITRTKQLYFDVLLAEEAVRLNQESVRRVRQALDETKAMQRAGLMSEYDVLRLEVELANLEPALRRAENSAEAARRNLAVEMALDDVRDIEVAGSLGTVDVTGAAPGDPLMSTFGVSAANVGLEDLLRMARSNRSEVRQAQLTEELRRTELRAEQSEYLPRLSFFASYGVTAQADGGINPFGWGSGRSVSNPQVGLQVTVPVFGGFRRPARVQQLRATLNQVQTQGRLLESQVETQVQTLYDRVEETRSTVLAQQTAVARARRGYEIASAQFREGLGTRLELTDAEVALRQSEFNLAQAVHDHLITRAQLDQAVGAVPEAR